MLPANAFCDFLEIFAGISGIDSIERPTLKTGASGPLQCPNLDVVGGLRLVSCSNLLKVSANWTRPPRHCALGAILDLLYKSKTSGGKVMKFTPSYTFTKRNILVKKFWPLKARKAMLK